MKCSLILTVFNEADSLPALLHDISVQTSRPDEIVFVDAGSTDGTEAIIRQWQVETGLPVRFEIRQGCTISQGRNEAIALARNDFVVVTDGGTRLKPVWFEEITSPFVDSDVHVVSGFFEPKGVRWFESLLGAAITPTLSEIDPNAFLPSSRSVAFSKHVWKAAGGYPEWLDYCEDLIFDLEMKKVVPEFRFAPAAIVGWNARPNVLAFVKQYYRYARGDGKAGLWAKRHALRYGAYLSWCILAVAMFWWPILGILLGLSLALYHQKFLGRVVKRWTDLPLRSKLAAPLVPLIVIAGDFAKMAGYPVGVRWRSARIGELGA